MPPHIAPGWRLICQNKTRDEEDRAIEVGRWVEAHGRGMGVRVPNAQERARATGQGGYLLGLKLSPRELYDAVGNYFDPDPVAIRLGDVVKDWAHGRSHAQADCMAPSGLLKVYSELRRWVQAVGPPAQASPFPRDVQPTLCELERSELVRRGSARSLPRRRSRSPTRLQFRELDAAEHGRRGR